MSSQTGKSAETKSPESTRSKFEMAKALIQAHKYDEARQILYTINHPLAFDWLDRIDQLSPRPPSQVPVPSARPIAPETVSVSDKNFTNAAVMVLVLYFLLWIPGLLANFMYLHDAEREEKKAGHNLPGVEALRLEVYTLGLIPGVLIAIYVAIIIGPLLHLW